MIGDKNVVCKYFSLFTLFFSVKLNFFTASQSCQSVQAGEVVYEFSECVSELERIEYLQIAKNV
jgi:hypothetical protein